jgi:hypothetical protein
MFSKDSGAKLSRLLLFLLARSKRRLPTGRRALLARRCGDYLDLVLLWLFGLSIAFSHAILPGLKGRLTRMVTPARLYYPAIQVSVAPIARHSPNAAGPPLRPFESAGFQICWMVVKPGSKNAVPTRARILARSACGTIFRRGRMRSSRPSNNLSAMVAPATKRDSATPSRSPPCARSGCLE